MWPWRGVALAGGGVAAGAGYWGPGPPGTAPTAAGAARLRAPRVAGLLVADGVEERGGRRGAADQARRVGHRKGVVPGAVHHERQLEGDVVRPVEQAGAALEVEVAGGNRGRAGERDLHRRAVNARILDIDRAVRDLQHDIEPVDRGPAVAHVAP